MKLNVFTFLSTKMMMIFTFLALKIHFDEIIVLRDESYFLNGLTWQCKHLATLRQISTFYFSSYFIDKILEHGNCCSQGI